MTTLPPLEPAPHHLPPCRRVKVAWLGEILLASARGGEERANALLALRAIDEDNPRALVLALRHIRDAADRNGATKLRDLAEGAALGVEAPTLDVCSCGHARSSPPPAVTKVGSTPDTGFLASARRSLVQRHASAVDSGRVDVARELAEQLDAFDQTYPAIAAG